MARQTDSNAGLLRKYRNKVTFATFSPGQASTQFFQIGPFVVVSFGPLNSPAEIHFGLNMCQSSAGSGARTRVRAPNPGW